jgi:hypothetical protein
MLEQEHFEEFFNDGLHFSDKGNHYLWTLVKEKLDELVGQLEFDFPHWSQVNHADPEETLSEFFSGQK